MGICMENPTLKKISKLVYVWVLLGGLPFCPAWGEETPGKPGPSAEAIIKASNKRIYGMDDQTARVIFRVVDLHGEEKKTVFRLYWKNNFGREEITSKSLLVTEAPENDRGIKFLIWENVDEEKADLWLYLPELRQVRRIQHGRHLHGKEEDSDLLFEDMRQRSVEQDQHRLLVDEPVRGELCYVVESRPIKKSLYGKRRYYIAKKDGTVRRIDYFSEEGKMIKTQWIDWTLIGRHFVWKSSQIFSADSSRKTFVELEDVKVNVGLQDDLFSERALRK